MDKVGENVKSHLRASLELLGHSFLYGILFFLFLQITTLHLFFSITQTLPLENLSLLFIIASMMARLMIMEEYERREVLGRLQLHFGLFLSLAAVALLSSIVNSDYLTTFYDLEWRTFLKGLFVVTVMTSIKLDEKEKKIFCASILTFFNLLGLYFFYRYLILQEIRPFDQRPLLNIRHGDPNFMGTFFATVTPLTWWLLTKRKMTDFISGYLLVSFIFLSLCLLATQSRMAILAYTLFFGATLLLKAMNLKNPTYRRYSFFLLIVIVLGVISFILKTDLGTRFSQMFDKSNYDRVGTYLNGVILFANSPVFGVGMHQAAGSFYENAYFPLFQTEFQRLDVHNIYLKYLAELGFLGLLCSLGVILYVFRAVYLKRNLYLLGSLFILVLCTMSVGISYKDVYYILLGILLVLSSPSLEERKWPSSLA